MSSKLNQTHDGALYLAGPEGVAVVKAGRVAPVLRFTPAIVRHMFTPTRLGRFPDGSFILTSPYHGIYVLARDPAETWRPRAPSLR